MKTKFLWMAIAAFAAVADAASSGRTASATSNAGGSSNSSRTIRIGGCCRKLWTVYPRPEFNPPDDIATLPEREQQKFIKAFNLVPKEIKVKSTQNYQGRIMFMTGGQYVAITNKLSAQLVRSAKSLAADPSVTREEVLRMCHDTLVYGRSLVMGRMEMGTFAELARQYRFKKAAKMIEGLEDSKNFRRGLAAGYPHDEPECRDFEALAKAVNPAQWQAFLARIDTLLAKHGGGGNVGAGQPPASVVTKKQLYDRYDTSSRHVLPDDMATLPNKVQARQSKIHGFLPVQVISAAGQDYQQRRVYLTSSAYAEVKQELAARLAKESRQMAADPVVTPTEVMAACDEFVKYGRPLVCGDMRHLSLRDLARTYRFRNVEKFVEIVEDDKNLKRGLATSYPKRNPEFEDFATLAQRAYPDRWKAFLSRLSELNRTSAQKISVAK